MEEQPIRAKAVQKPNAWVVDDSPSPRVIASRKLIAKGYFVYHATNGLDAREKLQHLPPVKLFVIDCQMGGKNQEGEDLDGPTFIAWIRQQDCYQKARIIGCSAVADQMRQETTQLLSSMGLASDDIVFLSKTADLNHYVFDRSPETKKSLRRTYSTNDVTTFFRPPHPDTKNIKRSGSSGHLKSRLESAQSRSPVHSKA